MKKYVSFLLALAMVLGMAPVMVLSSHGGVYADAVETESISGNAVYSKLYEQNGLTLLLMAYNGATVDLNHGEWFSSVGDYCAYFAGGAYDSVHNPTGWRMVEGGGVGYRFTTAAQYSAKSTSVGLQLPTAAIGDGNFSVEAVFAPKYVSYDDASGNLKLEPHDNKYNADGTVVVGSDGTTNSATNYGNRYGAYTYSRSTFSFAGLNMLFFQPSRFVSGSVGKKGSTSATAELRVFYSNENWSAYEKLPEDEKEYQSSHPFGTYAFASTPSINADGTVKGTVNDNMTTAVQTLTVNRALIGDEKTSFVVSFKGQNSSGTLTTTNYSTSYGDDYVRQNFYELSECLYPFEAFFGLPSTVYSIRAYNRTLTPREQARNHFADLCAYYQADVSELLSVDDAVIYEIAQKAVNLTFEGTNKDALQTIINQGVESVAKENVAEKAWNANHAMYVQDGLVMLLDGYTDNGTIDLTSGKWYNLAPTAGYASFVTSSTATSNSIAWTKRTGGGVGYNITKSQLKNGNANGMYLDLGDGIVDVNSDYTVEYVAIRNRHTDSDTEGNNTFTNESRCTEKFGAWGTWSYFSNGHWLFGSSTPTENEYLLYNTAGYNDSYGSGAGRLSSFDTDLWSDNAMKSMSVVITANDYQSTYTRYKNTAKVGNTATAVGTKDAKNKTIAYVPTATSFFLMQNVANTLYAVRVYDRALTADEVKQNYFADICAFYGVDVSKFDLLDDTVKKEFYALGVSYTFAQDAATVRNDLQARINEKTEGLVRPGDANGDNKVTTSDVTLTLRFLADWDVTLNETAADVTGDGMVTVADGVRIMQYLAGMDVELKKSNKS